MVSPLKTGSTLEFPSSSGTSTTNINGNKTSTALATNIIIKVDEVPVGAVQTLQIQETRGIRMIDEVGTDGHIDSAPNTSTKITGTCTRIRFDRLRIAAAFNRSFMHASSQIYPFDIHIIDTQKRNKDSYITTVIRNVWINNISYTYDASNWIITDSMGFEAETIFSMISGNKSSVLDQSERSDLTARSDLWWKYEVDADTGVKRGTMDVSGIIDVGNSGSVSDWAAVALG
jgi:hypothetical protein